MRITFLSAVFLMGVLNAEPVMAQEVENLKNKVRSRHHGNTYQAIMSTHFDFDAAAISGEMKAPDGFFLQGRQTQSLSQMVKLRSSFKRQLRNSKSGVRGVVK